MTLSSAQNAFALTELAYDNGILYQGSTDGYTGVRFSLPPGVTSAQILYVRFSWASAAANDAIVHITGSDHTTELMPPVTVTAGTGVGCPAGWSSPVFSYCGGLAVSVVVTGDFYVVLQTVADPMGNAGEDNNNSGRSFWGTTLSGLTNVPGGDYLIRVDIEPIAPKVQAPVGGVVEPVNNLAIAAPYLALFGVIAAVAVVVWKKHDN